MKGIPFRGVPKNAFRADTLGGTGAGRVHMKGKQTAGGH